MIKAFFLALRLRRLARRTGIPMSVMIDAHVSAQEAYYAELIRHLTVQQAEQMATSIASSIVLERVGDVN